MEQDLKVNDNSQINNLNNESNNKGILKTIVLIIIGILITIIISILIAKNITKKPFYGKWLCNDNIELFIDNSNFNMNYGNDKVEATYGIESADKINNVSRYTIGASAKKRIINGKEDLSPYSTKYQIAMEQGNDNELVMINIKTYNLYSCKKVK